jgi:hypothetical protein
MALINRMMVMYSYTNSVSVRHTFESLTRQHETELHTAKSATTNTPTRHPLRIGLRIHLQYSCSF